MESHHVQVLSLFLILCFTSCFTSSQTTPSSLILPISKDILSQQYNTNLSLGTPPHTITVTIDLAGPFLWLTSDQLSSSSSSTLHSSHCHSLLCSLAHFSQTKTLCNKNNSCILYPNNTQGELTLDVLTLHSSNGLKPTSIVSIPNFPFLLLSSPTKTLPIAGLGSSEFGLPKQLAGSFNFSPKFAICLPRESGGGYGYGVVFVGEEPYVFSPGIDVSKLLTYIPLDIVRPNSNVTMSRKSYNYDYYVTIKSIWVNGKKKLHFNSSLLTIDKQGNGGTRFSTIHPYSIMETSIFNSLAKVFIEEALASNLTLVPPIEPFGVCFSTSEANGGIPIIDLVFRDDYSVFWRIFATNSMVQVEKEIMCLGFIDGGVKAGTSIVVGGRQLEDNLLQFDLVNSRVGFSSSLLLRETDCSSFDFTSMSL